MSDCSTNAMKPKEPPKTCGNCGNRNKGYFMDCLFFYGHPGHDYPRSSDRACEHWEEETDTLEQRCQQLEQVAKELYKEYEQMEAELCDFIGYGKLRDKYVGGTVFKSHLTNLGVGLDD